ncbi:MAG TPA: DUF2784 domain-containing protein [Vicinamibacterales bacterium]|jgi:hypothetical protein
MAHLYLVLADLIVCIHIAFVVFVIGGGLLVWRWRWVAWLHLPAATWGAAVELTGWMCPLTPLENALRVRAGATAYRGDFVAHYLLPVLYPADLTREVQFGLAALVIAVNVVAYWWVWRPNRKW